MPAPITPTRFAALAAIAAPHPWREQSGPQWRAGQATATVARTAVTNSDVLHRMVETNCPSDYLRLRQIPLWCFPFRNFRSCQAKNSPTPPLTDYDEMPAAAAHRAITDDLLAVMVRIKREAGVGHSEIQSAIDQFACQQQWEDRTGGIGFPLVEDIPQERRSEFMAAIVELSPHPEGRDHPIGPGRYLSVVEIWPSRVS